MEGLSGFGQAVNNAAKAITANTINELGMALTLTTDQNAWLNVLVNKVGMTIVRTKLFTNPLSKLKEGTIPLGYVIEELAANPATVNNYSNATTTAMLNHVKPDVKAVYHKLNSQKFTKVSIAEDDLESAFKDMAAFEKFLGMITNTLYTGAEIYEYKSMKATIKAAVDNGHVVTETLDAPTGTQASADAFIHKLKTISNDFKFPSTKYNKYADLSGAVGNAFETWTPIEDQVLIIRSDILATLDIYAMAKAFNVEYEKLIGNIIAVDFIDADNKINALLCDKSFFVFRNKLDKTTSFFNGESLVWNYWYHFWRLYDISPLCNAVAFVKSN